jgi:hypothetical protein
MCIAAAWLKLSGREACRECWRIFRDMQLDARIMPMISDMELVKHY